VDILVAMAFKAGLLLSTLRKIILKIKLKALRKPLKGSRDSSFPDNQDPALIRSGQFAIDIHITTVR
jgi:hypothetical protein